jgi:hypothetical protein
VLPSRFAIIRYPAFTWSQDQLWEVMQTCVILHNMIIKNDRKTRVRYVGPYECQGPLTKVDHPVPAEFADLFSMHTEILDNNVYAQLQYDLI